VEVREVHGCSQLKFNFSAHLNTMVLIFFGGLQKMCMFHEPEGFWTFGLLDFWTFGQFWTFGFLDCFGLLDFWIFGLLGRVMGDG
jgi:hypothetical protein